MTKSVCSAIYHGLCVTAYGSLNPCCATKSDFMDIDSNTDIEDYWYNNEYLNTAKEIEKTDQWVPECVNCLSKSQRGLISRKDKFDQWYPDVDSAFTEKNPQSIVHFDISFGNSCNQKCIMCNSRFSSQWLSDDIALKEENSKIRNFRQLSLKNWSISYEQLDQIANLVDEHTRKIEIKGGEPLYDKRFEYFVDRVIERNPNVAFSTNTNGTHFNDKNIDMLNRIKKINIDVSIDGTGKLYEWIRNSSWDNTVKNWENIMQKLNHNPNLNYTTMCYNVDHLQQMYYWAAEMSHKYSRATTCNFTQVVTHPAYMAPEYADKERLYDSLKQMEHIIEDPEQICQHSDIFKPRLQILYNYIKGVTEKEYNQEHYDNFKTMHKTMSRIRGWDIHDYANV